MSRNARAEALSLWRRLKDEYERYGQAVRVLPVANARIQDDLRRYLCLRCAGFLERVTLEVIHGHIELNAYGSVAHFAKKRFSRAPNLRVAKFEELIGQLGREHSEAFAEFLDPVRKEALKDLMDIRNDVAHGKEITGAKLAPERYITLCEEVHDWLVEHLLGDAVQVFDEDGEEAGYEFTGS